MKLLEIERYYLFVCLIIFLSHHKIHKVAEISHATLEIENNIGFPFLRSHFNCFQFNGKRTSWRKGA